MKNSFYFLHDCNARNDEKILELRSKFKNEGYIECMLNGILIKNYACKS